MLIYPYCSSCLSCLWCLKLLQDLTSEAFNNCSYPFDIRRPNSWAELRLHWHMRTPASGLLCTSQWNKDMVPVQVDWWSLRNARPSSRCHVAAQRDASWPRNGHGISLRQIDTLSLIDLLWIVFCGWRWESPTPQPITRWRNRFFSSDQIKQQLCCGTSLWETTVSAIPSIDWNRGAASCEAASRETISGTEQVAVAEGDNAGSHGGWSFESASDYHTTLRTKFWPTSERTFHVIGWQHRRIPCGPQTTAQSQAKYVSRVGKPGEFSLQISHCYLLMVVFFLTIIEVVGYFNAVDTSIMVFWSLSRQK